MRLFFAYWPSVSKAREIVPWVEKAHALFGGRVMRTDTLHMTLAFLGETDPDTTGRLVAACRGWSLPTGSMVLNQPGRFKNAKVEWLGPEQRSAEELEWLHRAHQRLWGLLQPLGWQPREPQFRPHVSLLRNAGPGALDTLQGPAVSWSPDRCVLVGSRPSERGSHYTVLAELALFQE